MTNEPLASELAAIDRLLAEKRPEVRRSLRAGAAPAALARVPAPLAALFAWHDGQEPMRSLSRQSNWCLHSIESAIEAARFLGDPDEDVQQPWRPEWFPVLDNGAGDHVVFDPASGALIEYRHDDPERPRAWDDLAAWARELRAELEDVPAPVALAPAQRWILAVGGVLTHMNDDDHQRLGFGPVPETSENAAAILRDAWDVRTMGQATSTIEWLLREGHRASYGDPRIAAWDLGRAVNVAGWAYAAGLLDEPGAWGFMTRAASAAQAAFGSWAEYGASYAAGRLQWMHANAEPDGDTGGDTPDEAPRAIAALLAPGGAWAALPWATPLDGAALPPDGRAELRVAPGDGTLAAALAAAPRNARLVLAPGEYRGAIAIERHVELVADGGAVITADASPAIAALGASAWLRGLEVRAGGDAIHADDGRLVMDRCRVRAGQTGIDLLSGGAEATLRGCTFDDCGGGAIVVESGYFAIELSEIRGGLVGVQIAGEADAIVASCRVLGSRGMAIAVAEEAVAIVNDCELAEPAGQGLQLTDRAQARVHAVTIHHGAKSGVLVGEGTKLHMTASQVHDQGGTGVCVEATHDVELVGCTLARNAECGLSVHGGGAVVAEKLAIEGGPDDGVWIDTSSAVLAEVRVTGVGGCGVRVEEGTATITGLDVRGAAASGLYLGRGAKVTIEGSAIVENTNVGIEAGEASELTAVRCAVGGNTGDDVFAYERATIRLEACEVHGGPGTALVAQEDGVITIAGSQVAPGAQGLERAEQGGKIVRL